jgi:hypothetical protein
MSTPSTDPKKPPRSNAGRHAAAKVAPDGESGTGSSVRLIAIHLAIGLALDISNASAEVVAGIAYPGLDLVADIPEIVTDIVSVDFAAGLLDVLLGFAEWLLDVVHVR